LGRKRVSPSIRKKGGGSRLRLTPSKKGTEPNSAKDEVKNANDILFAWRDEVIDICQKSALYNL